MLVLMLIADGNLDTVMAFIYTVSINSLKSTPASETRGQLYYAQM